MSPPSGEAMYSIVPLLQAVAVVAGGPGKRRWIAFVWMVGQMVLGLSLLERCGSCRAKRRLK